MSRPRVVFMGTPQFAVPALEAVARACDVVAVVSAPAFLQAARVLARPGMTRSRLDAVLAKQMPDGQKRRKADVVIPTGLGKGPALKRLKALVRMMREGKWPQMNTDKHR